MGARRWVAGLLAIFGGLLMAASGYSSRGFLYMALGYVQPDVTNFLSGIAANAALLAIALLETVIALGGITVMVGGMIILNRHTTLGRVLISLGGGAGFLGFLISFGYSAYRLGLDPVLAYLPYWAGLAIAIAGSRLAKGS